LGRTSQKVGATAVVTISCPEETCSATATGTVRVPRLGRTRAKTYRLKARTTRIAKATKVTVRLKLSDRARVAITRALRAGKRIVLKLGVSVADRTGNVRRLTRQVTLK
jgi:hypothetical protein